MLILYASIYNSILASDIRHEGDRHHHHRHCLCNDDSYHHHDGDAKGAMVVALSDSDGG